MLNQISNTTILILVIWLSYITTQNSIHLKQIQSKPNTQTHEQISFQKNTLEKLNTLDDFVSKQQQLSQQLNQAQSTLEQYKQQANHYIGIKCRLHKLQKAECRDASTWEFKLLCVVTATRTRK